MFKLHSNLRGLITVFALFMSFATFAQNTISGTVKDDKNQPLPGVSVVIKGTAKGTISDNKGNYTIKNVAVGKINVTASFVGQKATTQAIDVAAGANTLNFTLQDDAMELESVIVTGVFDQRTKLESSVAITTLSPKIIEQRAARGTGDLLQAIPGIWTDNSSGEVGSKVVARGLAPVGNDQIGFQYLSLQEEGLPVMGAQMGFTLVDMFHRNDLNTGRFEAIRGGSAAITSANSPGGIFNFISKTGGAKFEGSASASASVYNNSNTLKRFDVEFGGPLSSNGWGYHLGGFYRVDAGARNTPFNANIGGQVKGNITKQFKKGVFKVYGKYLNDQNSYFKEIALKNDLSAGYDGGFGDAVDINNSTTFIDVVADVPLATDYRKENTTNPTRTFDAKKGIQNNTWSLGAELTTEIGKGWGLSLKAKHSDFDQAYLQYQGNVVMPTAPSLTKPNNLGYLQFGAGALVSPGTYASVPAPFNGQIQNSFVPSVLSPTYYDAKTGEVLAKYNFAIVNGAPASVLDPSVPNKLGNFILATVPLNMYNQVKDNIASLSITKEAGVHQITLGTFYSQTAINTQWFGDGVVSTIGNNPRAIRIEFPAPATAPAAVAGVPSLNAAFGGFYGAGKKINATDPNGLILQSGLAYTITENKSVLNAYFFNDVIKASERLNIDLGVRYETVRHTGMKQGWQGGSAVGGLGGLDKNLLTTYDLGSRVYNGQVFNYDQSYTLNAANTGPVSNADVSGDGEGFQFDYISWSAGLNYKLSQKTATYLRVSRGNKAPELDYYANNFVNIPLDKKAPIETVTQAEIGFKTNSKKASLSATAFYSYLDNALLQLFISNGASSFFTDPTFNASKTIGLELETVIRPTNNFTIRAHATLQDAKYDRLSYQNTGGGTDKTQFFFESFAGNRVKDVAPVILDITPSLKIGKFTPYVNYRWFSERQGNRRNSVQLASYGVLNAGITGELTSKFTLSVQGNNLLNSAGVLLFGGYSLQGTSAEDIAVGGVKSAVTGNILPNTNITELNTLNSPVFARPILARQLSVTLTYKF